MSPSATYNHLQYNSNSDAIHTIKTIDSQNITTFENLKDHGGENADITFIDMAEKNDKYDMMISQSGKLDIPNSSPQLPQIGSTGIRSVVPETVINLAQKNQKYYFSNDDEKLEENMLEGTSANHTQVEQVHMRIPRAGTQILSSKSQSQILDELPEINYNEIMHVN